jgi:hypothetical protein
VSILCFNMHGRSVLILDIKTGVLALPPKCQGAKCTKPSCCLRSMLPDSSCCAGASKHRWESRSLIVVVTYIAQFASRYNDVIVIPSKLSFLAAIIMWFSHLAEK